MFWPCSGVVSWSHDLFKPVISTVLATGLVRMLSYVLSLLALLCVLKTFPLTVLGDVCCQIREHMKQLAKKHKDKQELSRIKREAQTKHVGAVVQERQRVMLSTIKIFVKRPYSKIQSIVFLPSHKTWNLSQYM
jgi:hypothetical protein